MGHNFGFGVEDGTGEPWDGISQYIAKKIICPGVFHIPQGNHSYRGQIRTGVLDQFEVGIFGWDAGHFRKACA